MFSAEGEWSSPCEVRIADGSITVSYMDGAKFVVYEGSENGAGHFKVRSEAVRGRASLHCFHDDDILEGHWIENGSMGMWRIQLIE